MHFVIITPLIVTDRQEFFRKCENAFTLHGIDSWTVGSRLQDVKEKLLERQSNLIVIDAVSLETTSRLAEFLTKSSANQAPALFICLRERTLHWEQYFLRMGALYVFDCLMGESAMVNCMLQLYSLYSWAERTDNIVPELVQILRDCRISSRHKGYACIFDCVRLIYRQPDYIQSLTKKIYPYVAQLHHTTPSRVEKNIRDAVHNAWANGGNVTIPAVLDCGESKAPSNGHLIGAICEKLRETVYRKNVGNASPLMGAF